MSKEKFIVEGLAGKRTLTGKLPVYGAKNAALQALASSLLFADPVRYERVPDIEDVQHMIALLEHAGATVTREAKGVYLVTPPKTVRAEMPYDLSRRLRASIVLTGPMLARTGAVHFPHPGGCVIGNRPIDIFIECFQKMGAIFAESDESYGFTTQEGKLWGTELFLRKISVTGTQTLMMAATLANGVTTIKNAALEPETESLADFLNICGAEIRGLGTPTIAVSGGTLLKAQGRTYTVPPDRIEAGSFLILAAIAGDGIEITDCEPKHVESLVETLRYAGVQIEATASTLKIVRSEQPYRSVEVKTHEYPGFPTDLQAPMVVFLTQTVGEALVFETIFEGRLNYIESLVRMGAQIKLWDTHRASVRGPSTLHAKEVESPDIRAGLAFLIAAIIAKGTSVIHNAYYIDRGYEKIEERLRAIGVDIRRVSE